MRGKTFFSILSSWVDVLYFHALSTTGAGAKHGVVPGCMWLGTNHFKLLMLEASSSPSILAGHLGFISVRLHLFPNVIAQIFRFSSILKTRGRG